MYILLAFIRLTPTVVFTNTHDTSSYAAGLRIFRRLGDVSKVGRVRELCAGFLTQQKLYCEAGLMYLSCNANEKVWLSAWVRALV